MARSLLILLLLTLTFLPSRSAAATDNPITVRLSAHVGQAPLYLRINITIEKHPGNRLYCISAYESGLDEASIRSCSDLDGDSSPRFIQKEWKHVDQGDYVIVGELARVVAGKTTVLRSTPQTLTVGEPFPGK